MEFFCNRCLTKAKLFESTPQSSGPAHKWYLSECSHILCQNCRVKGNSACAYCRQSSRFMEISRKMPKAYQFFLEPTSIIADHLKKVKKFHQTQSTIIQSQLSAKQNYMEQKLAAAIDTLNGVQEKLMKKRDEEIKIKIIHNIIREEAKQWVHIFCLKWKLENWIMKKRDIIFKKSDFMVKILLFSRSFLITVVDWRMNSMNNRKTEATSNRKLVNWIKIYHRHQVALCVLMVKSSTSSLQQITILQLDFNDNLTFPNKPTSVPISLLVNEQFIPKSPPLLLVLVWFASWIFRVN